MKTRDVYISYFDPFDIFESLKSEFTQIFPLQNVHWKTSNGLVRTVDRLPIDLVSEDVNNIANEQNKTNEPFIRLLIVNCKSVDDYRSKVRPLVRQWLPSTTISGSKINVIPMIFLYANSEVIDSTIFKTVSLIDKFAKDFPNIKTLEIKSVYKSPKDKEEFWSQLSQQLRLSILDMFQQRLDQYQIKLNISKTVNDKLLLREKIFQLYSSFKLKEDAAVNLNMIKNDIHRKGCEDIPTGELQIPFTLSLDKEPLSISDMFNENSINKFKLYKYFLLKNLELLPMKHTKNQQSIEILSLVRKFLSYIREWYKDSAALLEFQYYFIESLLNILPVGDLSESNISLEVKAELLTINRDVWLCGVHIKKGYSIQGKCLPKLDINYNFDILPESYETENKFQETFLKKTKEMLSLFNQADSKRQRIVDILSIEIGTLYYQREEYEKAVNIFMSSYEYYTQSKWNVIGLNILKIFVDSLSKCSHLKTLQIEGADVPVSATLGNAYLNILKLTKKKSEKEKWWQKFLEVQEGAPTDLVHPIDGLFKINIVNSVYINNANTYKIDISIDNCGFPVAINVDLISLNLKNNNDQFMAFYATSCNISTGCTSITLESTECIFGKFSPVSLDINLGDTTFIKEFLDNSESQTIQVEQLYNPSSFLVDISLSQKLSLGNNSLDIGYSNLENCSDYSVEISVIPNGESYPVSFSSRENMYVMVFNKTENRTIIPYYLQKQVGSFEMEVRINFNLKDDDNIYSEVKIIKQECILPISVSVEDIFKKEFFYFKFHLNASVKEEPVILYKSKLLPPSDNNNYTIFGDYEPETPLYLKNEDSESCMNFYQIFSKNLFSSADIFNLKVTYNLLKEQIDGLVTDAILVQGDIEWYSKFEPWTLYWKNEILSKCVYNYSEFHLNRNVVLLSGTMCIPKMCINFRKLCINKDVHERMIETLKKISEGIQLSDIDVKAYTENIIQRELVVPVELPEFEQLFNLEFLKQGNEDLKVGEPSKFDIVINNLRNLWNEDKSEGSYSFEINSNNEWLIHGKKRMNILNEEEKFQVTLIPLKKGYLGLPKVQITDGEGESAKIDNPNAFETFLVL